MEPIKVNELILDKFKLWDFPIGPFIEMDEIYHDMAQFANYLGDENAEEFIKTIMWMIKNDYPHTDVVYEFSFFYCANYSFSISNALMKYITSDGPELLVELLGDTKDENAIDFIMNKIDIEDSNEELIISSIGAIGQIGGEHSLDVLQKLNRENLSKKALKELDIAIQNIQIKNNV